MARSDTSSTVPSSKRQMRRLCPSLNELQCFEAAARHQSFTRAATELHVTQGAVSRQIAALETRLGVDLFQRLHHRLVLTDAGQSYLSKVRAGLNLLESATVELVAHRGRGGVLSLSIPPTLATHWLIPRLPRFTQEHPEITLNFTHYVHAHDFAIAELDAALQYGEGVWPNAQADYIVGREIVVICRRDVADEWQLRSPADLAEHALLHHMLIPTLWQEWFDAMGLPHLNGVVGPRFDQFSLIIKAALAGYGAGVVPRCLVREDLARGTLVAPFDANVQARQGYYLCYPPEKRQLPALQALRQWLLTQAATDPVV